MPMATFEVAARAETATRVRWTARQFTLHVDEPPEFGGADVGPNPVEYVLAGLLGCLNVIGHRVAAEMGMPLRGLRLAARGDLDPARFQGEPTTARAGLQSIAVEIEADTDADEATLQRWLTAVRSRCPMSDNLATSTPVQISTRSAARSLSA